MASSSRFRIPLIVCALVLLAGNVGSASADASRHPNAPRQRPSSPDAIGTEHAVSGPTYPPSAAIDGSPTVAFNGSVSLEAAWSGTTSIRGVLVAPSGRVLTPGGFQVAVSTQTRPDDRPRVVSNGSGFLVVWQSVWSIFGVRVSAAGAVLDNPAILIRAATMSDAYTQPAVASDGAGYAVVWTRCAGVPACPATFPDPSDTLLETALVSGSGAVSLTGTLDPCTAEQYDPAIAWNGSTYLVAWADTCDSVDPLHPVPTIETQRLSGAGTFALPETNVGHDLAWQDQPAVASDGTNFLAAWTSGKPATAQDVGGGRVAADGTGLDGSVIAIAAAAGAQSLPAVTWDGANFDVAWKDTRSDSAGDLYAGRVASTGTVLDGSGFAVDTFGGGQLAPSVAAGPPGALVVWADGRTGGRDVYAARILSPTSVLDPTGLLLTRSTSGVATGQFTPAVAWDGSNDFGVWADGRNGVDLDVYGGRVDASGNALDGVGVPISTAAGEQSAPSIAWNGSEYLAVWADHRGANWDVYGTRIDADGAALDPLGIPISTAADDQRDPRVVANGSRFMVVWDDARGANTDVFAARVSNAGVVLDPAGVDVTSGAKADQTLPAVAWNGSHDLVVWQDARSDASGDVEGARLSTASTVLDPAGIPIAATPAHGETDPAVTTDGTQFLVTWTSDAPTVGTEILASRVSNAGHVAAPHAASDAGASGNDFAAAAWDGTYFLTAWAGLKSGSFDVLGSRITQSGARLDPSSLALSPGPDQSFSAAVASGTPGRTAVAYDRQAGESAYNGADHVFLRFFDEAPPAVASFSPPATTVGKKVTITGSGFVGANAVTFDGVPASTFKVVSDTQLTASVPDGALTGRVAVTSPLGTGTSPTDLLVEPKVDSFSPPSGPMGTIVTITGTAFTGATKVLFVGHKAAPLTVTYSEITVEVPLGALTGPLTVVTPSGKGRSATAFTVT